MYVCITKAVDDIGISLGSCQAIFKDVFGMKCEPGKIFPKLLNFEQKQRCVHIAQEMLTTFNGDPDWLKKGITADELKPNFNHPNGSVQKSQDRKKHVKFGQMGRFYSLFSSIGMAWSIMSSCHKVVRSIRNTTLKLCGDRAKQFVRHA